jgi:hypothetical protein
MSLNDVYRFFVLGPRDLGLEGLTAAEIVAAMKPSRLPEGQDDSDSSVSYAALLGQRLSMQNDELAERRGKSRRKKTRQHR